MHRAEDGNDEECCGAINPNKMFLEVESLI